MGKKLVLVLFFVLTNVDIYHINVRRSYYPNQFIGRIFENKLTYSVRHYSGQLMKTININQYLFSGHPREGYKDEL